MKKRVLFIIAIGVLSFAVFSTFIVIGFNCVSKNPIDIIAKEYIISNSNIENEYGEIISMGRNFKYESTENEKEIKRPYSVETKTVTVMVYVTLIKQNEEWVANSLEIIKVSTK